MAMFCAAYTDQIISREIDRTRDRRLERVAMAMYIPTCPRTIGPVLPCALGSALILPSFQEICQLDQALVLWRYSFSSHQR
jgi:hypothetical protein